MKVKRVVDKTKREMSEMEGWLQHLVNSNENKKIIASIYYILIWARHSSKSYTYEKTEEQQGKGLILPSMDLE